MRNIFDDKTVAIVAYNKNFVIGDGSKLLWYKPDDLRNFKKETTNNVVIMGSNTFLSLPLRPLPNRTNIVLTSDTNKILSSCNKPIDNLIIVNSIEELTKLKSFNKINFIIGGGVIYDTLSKYCDKLLVTLINDNDAINGVKFPIEKYNILETEKEMYFENDKTMTIFQYKLNKSK